MIIDYVHRLKELPKYQAYIIEQMNDKNKLVAAAKIQRILSR